MTAAADLRLAQRAAAAQAENEPLLPQQENPTLTVAAEVALKKIHLSQDKLAASNPGRPHKYVSIDFSNPDNIFKQIIGRAAALRSRYQLEATCGDKVLIKTDNLPIPFGDRLSLIAGDLVQALFSAASTIVYGLSITNSSLSLATKTPQSIAMQCFIGVFQIISGFFMLVVGLQEIKSAKKDIKESETTTTDAELKNLTIFNVDPKYQNLRLNMGRVDAACGVGVMIIGALSVIIPITMVILGLWGPTQLLLFGAALAALLTFLLLLPSIVPMKELGSKIADYFKKTDIGHKVEMDNLKSAMKNFKGTEGERLKLAKQLAITMFVMHGFDQDFADYFRGIKNAQEIDTVRDLFNKVFKSDKGKLHFNPDQMRQITAKALEYLKSRVGEEAAHGLIESFGEMQDIFEVVTTNPEAPLQKAYLTKVEQSPLIRSNGKIDQIKSYITKWNKAVLLRFVIQILYVVSFVVSIACVILTVLSLPAIGLPIAATLATLALVVGAGQSGILCLASIIPMLLDGTDNWRWLRGAALVADSAKLISSETKAQRKIKKMKKENQDIKDLFDGSTLEIPEVKAKLLEIETRVKTLEGAIVKFEWLKEVGEDEQQAKLQQIINERYLLHLYDLRIQQLKQLGRILNTAMDKESDQKLKREFSETLEKVQQNIIKLNEEQKARLDKIREEDIIAHNNKANELLKKVGNYKKDLVASYHEELDIPGLSDLETSLSLFLGINPSPHPQP